MKKNGLLAFIFMLVLGLVLTSCSVDENETIEVSFSSKIEYIEATLGEPCDLSSLVVQAKGWEYSLDAYQIDINNDMAEVKLETNGLSFTPTVYDYAHVTLVATKGKNVCKGTEVLISVVYPKDEILENIATSWHDLSFATTMNTDPYYIHSNKSTSLEFTWSGAEPIIADRWQYFATLIGDSITDYYSLSSWDNAVLTFWVYNPTDYELEFSPIWKHNGSGLNMPEADEEFSQVAAPNAWTEIKYSLKYYGIMENWYYDEGIYKSYITEQVKYGIGIAENGLNAINANWWTVRWNGHPAVNTFYTYNFFISDYDIRDYDPALDSDLDTTERGYFRFPLVRTNDLTAFGGDLFAKQVDTVSFDVKVINEGTIAYWFYTQDWQCKFGEFYADVNDPTLCSEGVTVTPIPGLENCYTITTELPYGKGFDKAVESTKYTHFWFEHTTATIGLENIVIDRAPIHPGKNTMVDGEDLIIKNVLDVDTETVISFEYFLDKPATNKNQSKFDFVIYNGEDLENCLETISLDVYMNESELDYVTIEPGDEEGWYVVTIDLSKAPIRGDQDTVYSYKLTSLYADKDEQNSLLSIDSFKFVSFVGHENAVTIEGGSNVENKFPATNKQVISFDYKLVEAAANPEESKFTFKIFTNPNWAPYFGNFVFNPYTNVCGDNGVTITKGEKGWYKFTIDLSLAKVSDGDRSAFDTVALNHLYVEAGDKTNCKILVDNFEVTEIEGAQNELGKWTTFESIFSAERSDVLSFEYKLITPAQTEADSKVSFQILDRSNWSDTNYIGYIDIFTSTNTGAEYITITEQGDGWYLCSIDLSLAPLDGSVNGFNLDTICFHANSTNSVCAFRFFSVEKGVNDHPDAITATGGTNVTGKFEASSSKQLSFSYKAISAVNNDSIIRFKTFNHNSWDTYFGDVIISISTNTTEFAGVKITAGENGWYNVVMDLSKVKVNDDNRAYFETNLADYMYFEGATNVTVLIDNFVVSDIVEDHSEAITLTHGSDVLSKFTASSAQSLSFAYKLSVPATEGNSIIRFKTFNHGSWDTYFGDVIIDVTENTTADAGVTITEGKDGWYIVVMDLSKVKVNNEDRAYFMTNLADQMYFEGATNCTVLFDNFKVEDLVNDHPHAFSVSGGSDIHNKFSVSPIQSLSFSYKVTSALNEDSIIRFKTFNHGSWDTYFGDVIINVNSNTTENTGVTIDSLGNGWYKVTLDLSTVKVNNDDRNYFNTKFADQMYFENATNVTILMDDFVASDLAQAPEVDRSGAVTIESGKELKNKFQASCNQALEFSYKLQTPAGSGDSKIRFKTFNQSNWGTYYGDVIINVTNNSTTFDGVSITYVGDGWYTVNMDLSVVTINNNDRAYFETNLADEMYFENETNCTVLLDAFTVNTLK